MQMDHSKWREQIITGWKADEDEDVNIDDSDDEGRVVATDKLQQELPKVSILLGEKREENLPWNKRALLQTHKATSSDLRNRSQCCSDQDGAAASAERNSTKSGTKVGGKHACIKTEPSSSIQKKKRQRMSSMLPRSMDMLLGGEPTEKCGGYKCKVLDIQADPKSKGDAASAKQEESVLGTWDRLTSLTDEMITIEAPPYHTSNIDLTHLRLAWVKVNDEGLRWPAKIVTETEVPPEVLKPLLPVHGKIVHLFHSEKNLQPYQVVKRSCIYPFEQYYHSWKNLKDAPEFTAAVREAYSLFCTHSSTVKESLSTARNAVIIDENAIRMEDKVPPVTLRNNEVEAAASDAPHRSIDEASTQTQSPETVTELQVVGKKRMQESTSLQQGNYLREKTTCVNDAVQYVDERLSLDVEILFKKKKRRIIMYDTVKKELELTDGSVLKIDPESLGNLLQKSSIGPMPRECIQKMGQEKVRSQFPQHGQSSKGLDYATLDQNNGFAKRLKNTWIREYDEESFVSLLRMGFVAACLMEEAGSPVNWAGDLSRDLGAKLQDIHSGKTSRLSAFDHRLLLKLLEHVQEKGGQSSEANGEVEAREVAMESSEEESRDWMDYNHLCQQFTFGGELLNEPAGSMEPADPDEQISSNNGSNAAAEILSQITKVTSTTLMKQEIKPHDNPIPVQVKISPRIMHIGVAEEGQLGDVVAKCRNMCQLVSEIL